MYRVRIPRIPQLRLFAASALAALLVAVPVPSQADDDDPPVSPEDVRRVKEALEAKGYRDVHDIEHDDGRIEVDATDASGHPVDIELDPKTLEILFMKRDD